MRMVGCWGWSTRPMAGLPLNVEEREQVIW